MVIPQLIDTDLFLERESERKVQARKNQWFGIPGNGGYAKAKKLPAREDDPILGRIEEDAREELRRYHQKQKSQMEISPSTRRSRSRPRVEFQDIEEGQVLVPRMEFTSQDSPAWKRKQAQEPNHGAKRKRPILLRASQKENNPAFNPYADPTPGGSRDFDAEHAKHMKQLETFQKHFEKAPKKQAALEKRLSGEKLKLPTPKKYIIPKITPYKDRVKRVRKPKQL